MKRGREALRLWARPSMGADAWWDDLEPYLTAQAQQDYSYTDPANVPVTKLTGAATLVELDTRRVAIVHVPTDAGLYAVTLSRSPESPTWLVERIAPPEPDPHGREETITTPPPATA